MISDHEILEALAHGRRRSVCKVLAAADREFLSLEEVSERVTANGENRSADARPVRVELHHVHLPKLDEAGLLEYDHRVHTVYYEQDPVVEALADGARPLEAARARVDAE
ncbi:DUF7344 domain-containing protein [Natronoarchaeum rubrum]|uniref:DUF7344 domain-containing protein n=1 Tax=Natronoarchaeum rubrum TaxID=755311 RepID=UPI00211107F1|nr:hypothetical protein [Natronoarchaeum rubrum]